jgi:hypothetical protein
VQIVQNKASARIFRDRPEQPAEPIAFHRATKDVNLFGVSKAQYAWGRTFVLLVEGVEDRGVGVGSMGDRKRTKLLEEIF